MRMMMRSRIYVAGAVALIVAAGLTSRKWPWLLPAMLGKYPGDALWAAMVYWIIAFIAPSAPILRVAAYALAISYLDELSQIYQSPWINEIRTTTIGHLLLGSAFSCLDLIAYTIGIGLCGAIELLVSKLCYGPPNASEKDRNIQERKMQNP